MLSKNLIIIGKGTIGSELLRQIESQQEYLLANKQIDLRVVAVCGSREFIYEAGGLDLVRLNTKIAVGEFASLAQPYDDLDQVLSKLAVDLAQAHNIVVDLTAEDFSVFHIKALAKGLDLVTANKKPVSDSMEFYKSLTQNKSKYRYEATVGAGLPIISSLQDMINTGDQILEIQGCFSGTLGFICSELESGKVFSQIVKEAKELGYTEPHPRDDLNGLDVARKAVILAREIGLNIGLSDVSLVGMVSEEFCQIDDVDKFMKSCEEENQKYQDLISDLKSKNQVPRFVAQISKQGVSVSLQGVAKSSSLGSLSGPDNICVIKSQRYSTNPLVIQGPGAGAAVTAAGVFADILKIN